MTPAATAKAPIQERLKIPLSTALLGLLATVLSFVVGFSFHNGQMEQQVQQHDVEIQQKVNKDEFREFSKRMDQGMDQIETQLREINSRMDDGQRKGHRN